MADMALYLGSAASRDAASQYANPDAFRDVTLVIVCHSPSGDAQPGRRPPSCRHSSLVAEVASRSADSAELQRQPRRPRAQAHAHPSTRTADLRPMPCCPHPDCITSLARPVTPDNRQHRGVATPFAIKGCDVRESGPHVPAMTASLIASMDSRRERRSAPRW